MSIIGKAVSAAAIGVLAFGAAVTATSAQAAEEGRFHTDGDVMIEGERVLQSEGIWRGEVELDNGEFVVYTTAANGDLEAHTVHCGDGDRALVRLAGHANGWVRVSCEIAA